MSQPCKLAVARLVVVGITEYEGMVWRMGKVISDKREQHSKYTEVENSRLCLSGENEMGGGLSPPIFRESLYRGIFLHIGVRDRLSHDPDNSIGIVIFG